ncbi:hypothetical protein C8J57DRAFT_1338232 [Mycena rebaudengoi]|nr:hypothetical protein C8J57DRAFT_1338232 [Mycena rebaudengoi]
MPPFTGTANVGQITSPVLFGGLIVFFLFGALTVQLYVYTLFFPHDKRGVKALVYGIYLTMLVCLCLDAADLHFWFAAGFGDLDKFQRTRFAGVIGPIVGSLVGLCVQLFFAYRISMFRQAVWFSGLIVVISLVAVVGGIGGGITPYLVDNGQVELLTKNQYLIYTPIQMWLICSAVSDVFIAAAMTYLLTNTAEPGTQHIVKRVVRLIVETNTLTASVALVDVILFTNVSKSTYWLCPAIALPEIYANTLLLVLNNRASPNRNAPPSSNNISSDSEGTTPHTHTPGLPHSRSGYEDAVAMKPMSPSEKVRSLSPRRSDISITFLDNSSDHPRVHLGRDFAVCVLNLLDFHSRCGSISRFWGALNSDLYFLRPALLSAFDSVRNPSS